VYEPADKLLMHELRFDTPDYSVVMK
jgi:hypothetical protein